MADEKATSTSSITPLEGKTTLDDKMRFEPQRLSYESTDKIAEDIVKDIGTSVTNKTVVIVGTAVLADFVNLQAAHLELDRLETAYKGIIASAGDLNTRRGKHPTKPADTTHTKADFVASTAVAATGVTALLNAGLGIISLFRQDVEYHGTETTIDALTFEIAVAARLLAAKATTVYIADLLTLPIGNKDSDSLRSKLLRIENLKTEAWRVLAPFISELAKLDAQLDKAVADKDQPQVDKLTDQSATLRRDLQPISDPLSRADQRLLELDRQWSEVDASTGLSGFARLFRAEALRGLKGALYLHAAVVFSGGHYRIIRNLWRSLFTGDGVSFMGGSVARWALLNEDGSIAAGGMKIAKRVSDDL